MSAAPCPPPDAPDGLKAIYKAPRTNQPNPKHHVYPYRLKGLFVDCLDHTWCRNITCISFRSCFLCLVAMMDRATPRVLGWRLSNTMDTGFCIEAQDDTLARYDKPEIFTTDRP